MEENGVQQTGTVVTPQIQETTPQTQNTQDNQQSVNTITDFGQMSDEDKIKVIQQLTQLQETPTEQVQATEPDNSYSQEEFMQLTPDKIDPNRLPGQVAKDVDKRYRQWFEEAIVPQLQELQRYRNAANPQQTPQLSPEQMFQAEVIRRSRYTLGGQIDMNNPAHVAEITRQSNALSQEIQGYQAQQAHLQQTRATVMQTLGEIKNELPNFDEVNLWAEQEMKRLPYENYQKVLGDLQSGNPQKIKAVYQMFADRYKQQNGTAIPQTPTDTPPSVLGGSSTEPPAKAFSYKDFASGSEDEQKKMLIDMGLI